MNRKLLLFVSVFAVTAIQSFGQCTINSSLTTPGYYPATGFPSAVETVPFSQVVQVRVLADTTVAPFGLLPIDNVQMDSVIGMPTGFSYSTNPANGKFLGGTNGCLMIMGTPTTGQSTGGPTHNGIYPLTVYYHATVSIAGSPTNAGTSKNQKYTITIIPFAAGINEVQLDQFSVFQNTPNPTDGRTEISYWMPSTDNVQFRVYNMLGSLITDRSVHADRGNNTLSFDTSSLTPGIYLYSFQSGGKTVTRRMIVSAH